MYDLIENIIMGIFWDYFVYEREIDVPAQFLKPTKTHVNTVENLVPLQFPISHFPFPIPDSRFLILPG